MSEIIRCCTEIGVTQFVPVITERCISTSPSAAKQARWAKIAESAAIQSQLTYCPTVNSPIRFKELADYINETDSQSTKLVPWESESPDQYIGRHLKSKGLSKTDTYSLFIGPEGGISHQEIQTLQGYGFSRVSLGESILRVENAAFFTASVIKHQHLTEQGTGH